MRTAEATPVRNPWKTVDPLADALRFLRTSDVFYCRSEFRAPWALALPAFDRCMMFHVVTEGRCWVDVDGRDCCLIEPGTVALVPHGEGHQLIGEPGVRPIPLFEASRELLSERYEFLRHGGGGARTSMLCGLVRFDHPATSDLIRMLPRVICMDVRSSPQAEWLHSTLRLVAAEAQALRAGSEAILTRLADILVVEAVRSWITRERSDKPGWLGALRDKQIGLALSLIQRDPTRDWTVASLAAATGMSRSTFAARFTELVGIPAMRYVTQWRMHAAELSLREERTPLGELADRLGYSTEAAFSRAFKRVTGQSPGSVKRPSPSGQKEKKHGRREVVRDRHSSR